MRRCRPSGPRLSTLGERTRPHVTPVLTPMGDACGGHTVGACTTPVIAFSPFPLTRTFAVAAATAGFILGEGIREDRLQGYLNEELDAPLRRPVGLHRPGDSRRHRRVDGRSPGGRRDGHRRGGLMECWSRGTDQTGVALLVPPTTFPVLAKFPVDGEYLVPQPYSHLKCVNRTSRGRVNVQPTVAAGRNSCAPSFGEPFTNGVLTRDI
jgi:hypothetical protein